VIAQLNKGGIPNTRVVARGTQRLPLGCCRVCKLKGDERQRVPYSEPFGQKDPPLPLRKLPLNPAAARVVSPELPRKLRGLRSQRFTRVRAIARVTPRWWRVVCNFYAALLSRCSQQAEARITTRAENE
jgi:hypothetical protein